jgi:hypothetical protein
MKYFITIFVTAVLIFLGATIYYKGLPSFPKYGKNAISTESGVPATSGELTSTPNTASESDTLITAIKAALIAKHGSGAATLNVTASKIVSDFAQGGVSDEGGGGMWFAAKVDGIWKLVWDGNGQINCSDIAPYPTFPKDMIPECWDTVMEKIVKR